MLYGLKPAATKVLVTNSLAILLIFSCVASCRKDPVKDETTPGANVIKGTIYDAQGNKFHIDGATVTIHVYGNGNIGETDPLYNIQMDANSHYELKVPNNVYAVHARAYMQLGGKTVAIDLKPLDGKADNISLASAPGIVRDFALQLTGEVPGGDPSTIQGYYGAKVWFGDGNYNFSSSGYWESFASKYPGAKVQFLLSPLSKLIDGTTGQNVQLEASVDQIKTGKWFVNIPYAVYRVTAKLITADGQEKPLELTEIPNISSLSGHVDLSFPPDNSDPFQRPQKEQVAVFE
ncbi:MAG: hypothetical protein ACXVBX_11395 [Flavisolibacter sp.]